MDPQAIPRPAADAGARALAAALEEARRELAEVSAMLSQLGVTDEIATTAPWQATTAYADYASVSFTPPPWATGVVILGGGHFLPAFDTNAGSP